MIESTFSDLLSGLPLGPLHYFDSIGSTNAEALRLANKGAPHLSLVVADEQTAGRGRMGRRWFTPPGCALAFSLSLDPGALPSHQIARLTALGALAVANALEEDYDLEAEIKWPNDVLVGNRKLAGVLVEADWMGGRLNAAVLGVGINVARDSIPPTGELLFPATCVEAGTGATVDRWALLRSVLETLLAWLPRLETPEFMEAWRERLSYMGEPVRIVQAQGSPLEGQLLGLADDGALRLALPSGEEIAVQAGDLHLRPGRSPTEPG